MIDQELLTLLDAIARHGSLAKAAAALDRVPSALSYTVRLYEAKLDLLLIDRRGHRAVLTQAAQEILASAAPVIEQLHAVARQAQSLASGWEPELRIALDEIISTEALCPLLAAFYALAVPTRVTLLSEVLFGTWDAVTQGRADLAVGASEFAQGVAAATGRVQSAFLGEVPFVFAIAASHPLAGASEPLTAAQIAAFRVVAVADTTRTVAPYSVGILAQQPVLTVASVAAKIQAQVAGLGVGWLPLHRITDLVRQGRLVIKQTESERPVERLHLAWRKVARGRALTWFRQALAKMPTDQLWV